MKPNHSLRTAGMALLLVALLVGLMNVAKIRPMDYEMANGYATSDVVYADGSTAHFDSKNFGRMDGGDVATLHLRLPEQAFYQDSVLLFYNYNAVTEVWFEGTLLESYGEDIAARGMMIGNRYFQITIPDEAWGSEIAIVVRATMDNAFSNFTNLRIYPAEHAYRYFVDVDLFGFVCAIVLFVLGLLGIFACMLGRLRGLALANALCLACAMLLISLWLTANEGIYTLFGFDGYFWQPLEYVAGYTIAIPLLLFYRGMAGESTKWRKAFGVAAAVVALFFAVATVLNFTNLLHYDSLMDLASVLLVASGALMLVYTIRVKADGSKARVLMKTGAYIFLPICLYEVFVRALFKQLPLATLISYYPLLALGVLLFFMCLVCAFIADLYDGQRDLLAMQIRVDTLDKVIAETPAGICQLVPDEALTIVSANDLFYKIMGYGEEELAQGRTKAIFAHLLEEEKALVRKKVEEVLRSRDRLGEFEISTVDPNSKPITALIRYFYDCDGSGNITINVIDITERKRMEEDLRVGEERYKLALEKSGKVFFFFDVPTRTMRLSQELADAFGLPLEVDGMPDNFISQGLVEVESIGDYRHFYERIIAGEESGETVISCHMRHAPEDVLWYKIAFISIFDDGGHPASSIITYEDMNEQHATELYSRWKQLNLISVPEKDYVIALYDLTRNQIISQTGKMFTRMPEFVTGFDEINAYVLEHFYHEEDVPACRAFLDRQRLMECFRQGMTEDSIEYRSLQGGSSFRWTSMAVSLIEDPYNKHIMAQLLFLDIHDSKAGEIQRQQNMEELQRELDINRIKVMMNQMQPHFLYNALSAIQTIVKIDPDYAYQLLYDFSTHLRSSIKALSSDAPIPFKDELQNIQAYLNIEKMRLGDKLEISYEIACEEFEVIPLSIQPLAENATRHGVYPKGSRGGKVTVRTYELADASVVEVEDDGVGFDVQAVLGGNSDSVGLKNLIFRLKTMMDATVAIASEKGKGTKVTVTIPKGERS